MKEYKKAHVIYPKEDEAKENILRVNAERLMDKESLFDLIKRIEVRLDGNLEGKGFYLPMKWDWELVEDDTGQVMLLPMLPEPEDSDIHYVKKTKN